MGDADRGAPPSRGLTAADGTTKARLERAALNVFAEDGVDGATTREIARRAGVAEGTLYRHYKGKDELAEALFFAIHANLADIITNVASRHAGAPIERIVDEIVTSICLFADEDKTAFTYHLLHTHHFLSRRPDARDPVSAVEAILESALERNDIAPLDNTQSIELLSAIALGPVMQTALHYTYGRLDGTMSDYAPTLCTAVRAILGIGDFSRKAPE